MEKNKLSKNSSLLVALPTLCVFFALMLISAVAGYEVLSTIFLFFLLLFSFVRYWATKAMHGVSLEFSCDNRQLFPGMDTELKYSLKNNKLLPLVWLELSQEIADKFCVRPDESFEEYSYQKNAGETIVVINAYKRSFSLVMAYGSVSVNSTWHAERRGIYCPKELLLRSGDGFGLAQIESYYSADLLPEIVVYPRRVSVNGEFFVRQDWDSKHGSLGYKEDMSVIRGLRPYMNSDSFKRINWRMAARNPNELNVNLYETIQPSSVLFVLDGESYCHEEDLLERDLELISSLVDWLGNRGLSCGLCLPKSKRLESINIPPENQSSSRELMYYLAAYDCLKKEVLNSNAMPTGDYCASSFELAELSNAAREAGTVALFTNNPSAIPLQLLERLARERLVVFSSSDKSCKDKEIKVHHTSTLRKGECV